MTEEERNVLPSERARIQAESKKKAEEDSQKSIEMLRHDFAMTFGTEHGMRVLAWMKNRSDFGKFILAADKEGRIDATTTTYNAMELNHYLAIRQHVPISILQKVEYDFVKPSGYIEEPAIRTTSKDTSERK